MLSRQSRPRQQANQKPSLVTGDVITDQARMKIRLALTGDPGQSFVPQEHIQRWWEYTSVTTASEILCRYFLQQGTMDIPIGEILDNIPLVYNLANEAIEDSTFINMEVALTNWFNSHAPEDGYSMQNLASIVEKKIPRNSQLHADYMAIRAIDVDAGKLPDGFDNPMSVIQRIKRCLGQVRTLKKAIDRYGPYDQEIGGIEPAMSTLVKVANGKSDKSLKPGCYTCGGLGHTRQKCFRDYRGRSSYTVQPPLRWFVAA